jgi:hypothetical protein
MEQKTLTGARLYLGVYNPATGLTTIKGSFQSVSWGLNYNLEPIHTLGNYAPKELVYTSQDAISITGSMWRSYDHGPHAEADIPALQALLRHESLELVLTDKQAEDKGLDGRIAKFRGVRPQGYSTSVGARNTIEASVSFMALTVDDESTTNAESPGSPNLP